MIILLAILIVLSAATMDEIQFHWARVFGHWIKPGSNLEKWFNPSISWKNKYFKNSILTFIFSSILVWLTDFWHFLKLIFLSSIAMVILHYKNPGDTWGEIILLTCFAGLCWGVITEFIIAVYGKISDKYEK